MTGPGRAGVGTPVPVLHVVTDDEVLGRPGFGSTAGAVLRAGGPRLALHVRGPRTGGGALHRLTRLLAHTAVASGGLLVVNDRVDVALAAGVGAVQLGRRSLPPGEARRILGADVLLGVSTHADPEVAEAVSGGARWVFVGTIYATPTHPDLEPRGPAAIAGARRVSGVVPVVGIGGVTPERVAELADAGAHGVAVIRGVWDAPDPEAAVGAYIGALEHVGRAGVGAGTAGGEG